MPAAGPITEKYGIQFPKELCISEVEAELYAFNWGQTPEKGGLGKFRHLKNAINLIWPQTIWHEWMEWRQRSLCRVQTNAWTGCGGAGKTYCAAIYAMTWWLCNPAESSVILTSTTRGQLRKRIWPFIQEHYESAAKIKGSPLMSNGFPGHMVDSRTTIQAKKGDDKHGLYAIAVREGPVNKAVGDIQGIHSKRMMIVIDEATDTPEAIFQVMPNLRKGCKEFEVIIIGNALSHMDPHGRICEPVQGWSSVTVEDEEWETKGVPEWEIEPGVCLHFDGLKSPNLKHAETKYEFLPTEQDIARARKAEHASETIGWWKFTRGFWAPTGLIRSVFSEPMVTKHDGMGRFTFVSSATKLASLDPAFNGGDRCVLRFAELGDLADGRLGIQLRETVEFKFEVSKSEPIHYQISNRVKEECIARGVEPHCFAMDASGEGGGTADIISREWSDMIVRVEFGGAPSELPVSNEDRRLSNQVYDRKVTELWYSARRFLLSSQLKGLTNQDVVEFCNREYTIKGAKISIDTKLDCKHKIGKSPDCADAVVILVELARRLGAWAGSAEGTATGSDQRWQAMVQETNEVYAEESFTSPLEVNYSGGDW